MGDTPSLPNSKIEAEDRHANFYDARVNLGCLIDPARAAKPKDKELASHCTSRGVCEGSFGWPAGLGRPAGLLERRDGRELVGVGEDVPSVDDLRRRTYIT